MSKSVYSLVLSDEVIRAVDRAAYDNGYSRSGLINQILAEYVSMLTPEKHICDIFRRIAQLCDGDNVFQLQNQPSGNLLSIKSILNYKYNPTIRYSVEITVDGSSYQGEFRAVSRSQSRDLLALLDGFFRLWFLVESSCIPKGRLKTEISPGRMRRRLVVEGGGESYEAQELGDAIADYISLFDKSMNLYFAGGVQCEEVLQELYREYVADASVTV